VAFNDISERVQSLNALQRSQRILNDFFNQASIGLLWVDHEGRILRINQAHLDLLGCTRDEALNARIVKFHADLEAAADILRRLGRNEALRNYKDRLRRKDGDIRVVLIDANARHENGEFVHSQWFVRDITDRTELEQDVLQATDFEQQRIASDLHDDLGQHLTGLVHVGNALREQLTGQRRPEAELADRLVKLLSEANAKVRALAHGLQPVPLEPQGLTTALAGLAERVSSQFKIDCRFRCPASIPMREAAIANHLYRIALEAVNNILKHSRATVVEIDLAENRNGITLTVQDNGCGLPSRLAGRKGMGFRIMKYRAGVIGGSLVVQRAPLGGTAVMVLRPPART
jgi:PAS domain S-box-containing protein